jgi:hypothetical protein
LAGKSTEIRGIKTISCIEVIMPQSLLIMKPLNERKVSKER